MPDMTPVTSSNIKAIGYVDSSATMYVDFYRKGTDESSRYSYDDVPQSVFLEFLNAPSKGQYFAKNIKGRFTAHKLT